MTDIRALKIAICKSLSGSSDLTYHLGCDAQDHLHIRLWSNFAGGLHSNHWFSLAGILAKLTADKPITSGTLPPVCPGSRNNGSFILAALQREGLVKPIPDLSHGMMPVAAPPTKRNLKPTLGSEDRRTSVNISRGTIMSQKNLGVLKRDSLVMMMVKGLKPAKLYWANSWKYISGITPKDVKL